MSDNEITMSSRVALELLAGRKRLDDIGNENPFEEMLSQGKLIERVIVDKFSDEDDDYITFVFGEPDGAISDF